MGKKTGPCRHICICEANWDKPSPGSPWPEDKAETPAHRPTGPTLLTPLASSQPIIALLFSPALRMLTLLTPAKPV